MRITAIIVSLFFLSVGCDAPKSTAPREKKEMLIFCGITMIKPMMDIASIIEAREDIKIIITKGGSGNLLKSILYTKSGDLYLPGSDRYYQIIQQEHPGIVLETVHVGTNKAAIMVQRGNPRAISNDLLNFTSKSYAVVIGNANSGSIGNETQNILEKKGIYDRVLQNAMQLTTDSKDLTKVLVNRQADLVINWYAASTWDENRAAMEALEIDPEFARPQQLILGLLKYSKNRETARKFMAYAASDRGKAIFKHHGLYFD